MSRYCRDCAADGLQRRRLCASEQQHQSRPSTCRQSPDSNPSSPQSLRIALEREQVFHTTRRRARSSRGAPESGPPAPRASSGAPLATLHGRQAPSGRHPSAAMIYSARWLARCLSPVVLFWPSSVPLHPLAPAPPLFPSPSLSSCLRAASASLSCPPLPDPNLPPTNLDPFRARPVPSLPDRSQSPQVDCSSSPPALLPDPVLDRSCIQKAFLCSRSTNFYFYLALPTSRLPPAVPAQPTKPGRTTRPYLLHVERAATATDHVLLIAPTALPVGRFSISPLLYTPRSLRSLIF
jgi:hypothetical protein